MIENDATTARLLVTCPDKPGIISAVSTFLFNHGANITDFDQHSSDAHGGTFFLRLEFQTPDLDCSRDALRNNFAARVAERPANSTKGWIDDKIPIKLVALEEQLEVVVECERDHMPHKGRVTTKNGATIDVTIQNATQSFP